MNQVSIFAESGLTTLPLATLVEHINLRKQHYMINAPDVSELDVTSFDEAFGNAGIYNLNDIPHMSEGFARYYVSTLTPALNEILQIDLSSLFASSVRVQQVLTEQQYFDPRNHINNGIHQLPRAFGVLRDPYYQNQPAITPYTGKRGEGYNTEYSTLDLMILGMSIEELTGRRAPVSHCKLIEYINSEIYSEHSYLEGKCFDQDRLLHDGVVYEVLWMNEVDFIDILTAGYPIRADRKVEWSNLDTEVLIAVIESGIGLVNWLDVCVPMTSLVYTEEGQILQDRFQEIRETLSNRFSGVLLMLMTTKCQANPEFYEWVKTQPALPGETK